MDWRQYIWNFLRRTKGIVSLCLVIGSWSYSSPALADNATDATNNAIRAYYYYAGLDKVADKYKRLYVDTTISKDVQAVAANMYLISSVLINNEIHYVWSF